MHQLRPHPRRAMWKSLYAPFQKALARTRDPLCRDEQGAVAIEFAVIGATLILLLLNGVDLGHYLYLRSQVENAAQASAHATWKTCDPTKLPVSSKCPEWEAAATAAALSTSLEEASVTLQKPPVEGLFCPDAGGTLHAVSDPKTPPAECLTGIVPGYYVQTRITYTYEPLFGDVTVVGLLETSIAKTSHMRMQ